MKAPMTAGTNTLTQKKKRTLSDTAILMAFLVALFALFSIIGQKFLTYANISTMLNNMVIAGIIAIAITPVIVTQGLDISFGASLSLSTVIIAMLYKSGMSQWACLVIGFLLPVCVAVFNGMLAEFFSLIPLILTLATTSILIAIGQVLTNGNSILMITDQLFRFATKSVLHIPFPVIVLLLVLLIYWFLLSFTKIGRQIYFIGSNPRAAHLSGIRVRRIKIMLYVAMGIVTGISAIIMLSLSGIGYIYHGNNLTLPVLNAVFLGGMSLAGGEGSIWKTLIGVCIITVIFTGLSLMSVQFYFIQILQGLALVVIVAFYEIRKNRRAAKSM
jgi:ribose/xylose/arabinose/galactoside ABC-type transport system permease subunit